MDEVVRFDVRAVSRFFASPKAGRKCVHALFLCPLFKSFEADYFYTISTSHAWCIRLGYSICSSWQTSTLCQHRLKSSNLAAVLEELWLGKWRAGLSNWLCACAHLCKLHTLVPLFLMLATVDTRWKVSWEWELVLVVILFSLAMGALLSEFERDGLKWWVIDLQLFFVSCGVS